MNPTPDRAVMRVAKECLAVRVRMLNRIVTSLYDDALRPLDLKASQLNVLVAASLMGVARPAEVANRLRMDVSTLSRNVDRMKKRGWLEVVPDEDGRAQPFRITPEGEALLKETLPRWEAAQREARDLLGDQLAASLYDALASHLDLDAIQ